MASSSDKVTHGNCLCGAIEIKATGDFKASVACSCKNCQSCSGSAFSVNFAYPKDTVTIAKGLDDVRTYEDKNTDSGKTVLRRFCGRCGSAIYSEAEAGIFVKAPMMEGGLDVQPAAHVFARNLPGWAQSANTGNKMQASFE
ncbi:GFA family protein [Apiospora arundinis]|uniref:GFA family protein n=1 Tax=Apiospora arundinis TaxID=335852 RepID=A0ABR2IHP5_9PEZI